MKLVALGANLESRYGSPVHTLEAARAELAARGLKVAARSRVWKTAPVPAGQPWYYNQILAVETDLPPAALLRLLLAVETDFGRVREARNAPRVLDLDLLAYDDAVLHEDEACIVPHPRMHERSFVLLPLRDIAPFWVHPVAGRDVVDLLSDIAWRREDAAPLVPDWHRFAAGEGRACHVMGVVNVTPDSFSDGGRFKDAEDAAEHALEMMQAGAEILDIGGELTRPGAAPVTPEEEQARIIPVIERLSRLLRGRDVVISADTRHAATMEAAIRAGAGMINDISGLTGDGALEVLAHHPHVFACIMHMQGGPQTMQNAPHYDDVVEDVTGWLWDRLEAAQNAGIGPHRLVVDPGIGFGKTLEHNLALLSRLEVFQDLGVPVLLGTSRKSFIAKIDPAAAQADARLGGSLASALWGVQKGAQILRVHDVAPTVQAVRVWTAIAGA